MSPLAVSILIALINDTPAIVAAIQLANMPSLTPEQMAMLQNAMDAAVAKLDADIAAKFPAK